MNILFVHQNFPGQFKHLAPAIAADAGHVIKALHINPGLDLPGVERVPVVPARLSTPDVHPWVREFETKVIRGEASYRAARSLKEQGFQPDIIVAHPGWGESLFLADVWPSAKIGLYCEFYYRSEGADVHFDPEFPDDPAIAPRLRVKNAIYEMQMPYAAAGISPTAWQKSTFPAPFSDRISVIHDGINTDIVKPRPGAGIHFTRAGKEVRLTRDDEVITFVVRNLEPYRGYHSFMRALPEIMRKRPNAHIVIVGADGVSYGPPPLHGPNGEVHKGWKEIFLNEVAAELDLRRVHFMGKVSYQNFLHILNISSVHVYLTYPFVLSWSLLEAMSSGCAIVGSDTAPVREVIDDGKTGRLVDFFNPGAIAQTVVATLEDKALRAAMGQKARDHILAHYDLKDICLPAQMRWLKSLA